MLLRSSSTPVLGSLLTKTFSDSPNNHHSNHHSYCYCHSEIPNATPKHPSPSFHPNNKLSCKQTPPPTSLSGAGFRRAQSEGNLKELDGASAAASSNSFDEFSFSNHQPKHLVPKPRISTLEPIPSFSLSNSRSKYEEDEDSEEEGEDSSDWGGEETENSFGEYKGNKGYGNVGIEEGIEQMYLARGIGITNESYICNGGRFAGGTAAGGGGDSQRRIGIEEHHYKRLLEENPCNSLYLRNYASFLYRTKRNLESAEEYYSRAILEDPKDGEVLSEYANLLWDLHRDKDRATDYFQRAVLVSAEDSHVHAAFARFLWEIEEEEEDMDDASHGSLQKSLGTRESVVV